MRTRKQIKKRAVKLQQQIAKLNSELIELQKENFLLCDKKQWFKEEEETTGRGKTKQTRLVGRVYHQSYFIDEDTNKKIKFTTGYIVRIDGEWTFTR